MDHDPHAQIRADQIKPISWTPDHPQDHDFPDLPSKVGSRVDQLLLHVRASTCGL
jgi:hypothetical protein